MWLNEIKKRRKKMMKYLKILFLSLMVVGLMAGSAFAGTLATVSKSVASELIGAAAVVPVTAKAPISYRPEVDLLPGATFTLKVTNGKFNFAAANDWLVVCAAGPAVVAKSAVLTTSIDTVLLTVQAGQSLASGTLYAIRSDPDGDCVAPLAEPVIEINANTVAGTNVTVEVSASSVAGATAAAVTSYTVSNQLSATLTPVTSTIDFGAAMKNFKVVAGTPGSTATMSKAGFLVLSNEGLNNKLTTGATSITCATSSLAADDILNAAVSGTFTEVAKTTSGAVVRNAADGADIALATAVTATTTTATVAVPGDNIKICGTGASSADKTTNTRYIGITVDGTSTLIPRTFTSALTFAGTGTNIKKSMAVIPAGTLSHTWGLDASRYYIPLVGRSSDGSRETYIKLQSKSTAVGSNGVLVAILANDGTIAATYNPGTITSGVPMTITGAQLVDAATAAGKTVDGMAGFAVIVTVNAPEADVFAYANIVDPFGAKRIPVKTVGGDIVE
jgi:hypothetical protein